MVSACKNKFRPARDRAEFSDSQPVAVDWIMIQYVVLLKVSWIVHEIVVHGIFADFDVRVRNDTL